mmetsp:Transcript_84751/g.245010  ORF Transcript_84751/g.245010 Transcript_84751/m.245010 type:complete len:230 (+) Transcript_84751:247-936(+)
MAQNADAVCPPRRHRIGHSQGLRLQGRLHSPHGSNCWGAQRGGCGRNARARGAHHRHNLLPGADWAKTLPFAAGLRLPDAGLRASESLRSNTVRGAHPCSRHGPQKHLERISSQTAEFVGALPMLLSGINAGACATGRVDDNHRQTSQQYSAKNAATTPPAATQARRELVDDKRDECARSHHVLSDLHTLPRAGISRRTVAETAQLALTPRFPTPDVAHGILGACAGSR